MLVAVVFLLMFGCCVGWLLGGCFVALGSGGKSSLVWWKVVGSCLFHGRRGVAWGRFMPSLARTLSALAYLPMASVRRGIWVRRGKGKPLRCFST